MFHRSDAILFPGVTVRRATRKSLCLLGLGLVVAGCGGPSSDVATDPAGRDVMETELRRLNEGRLAQPQNPYWDTRQGELALQVEDRAQAEASFRAALALDPDYEPAVTQLGRILYESGRHQEGIALLEGAHAAHPDSPSITAGLALHHEARNDFDHSDALFDQLEARDELTPSLYAYRMLAGDSFLQAAEATRRAVAEDPDVAAHQNNHGISLLYEGDPDAAREAFRRALEIDPTLAEAMYNLAIVERFYFYEDEKARGWFARYQALDAADPDGLLDVFATDNTESETKAGK